MKLGEKIRTLRRGKKLTLEELALAAGMSKSYLWELENRETPKPSAEKLDNLAKVLSMPVSYFLEADVEEPEERHLDEAFFRDYSALDTPAKEQLRKIVEAFKKS